MGGDENVKRRGITVRLRTALVKMCLAYWFISDGALCTELG